MAEHTSQLDVAGLVEKARAAMPEWPHVQITVGGDAGATDLVSAYILACSPGALLALQARLKAAEDTNKFKSIAVAERRVELAEAALAQAQEEIGRLARAFNCMQTAISWLEPPFVDESTTKDEIMKRIGFMLADRKRAASLLPAEDGAIQPPSTSD